MTRRQVYYYPDGLSGYHHGGEQTGMPDYSIAELEPKIGETKQTVTDLAIEAGKVEEFARAIKDDNPIFRDETAARTRGFEAIPAPLTFTRVSIFPQFQVVEGASELEYFDLGFDLSQTVLGEREFEYERPMQVGDVLSGQTTLADLYQRENSDGEQMTFAVLETEYRDRTDTLVVTERSTVIELGGDSPGDDHG